MLHGYPEVERHVDDECDVHEEEGGGGDELDEHEPPGRHPLPDLPVLVAPDRVAAVVHPVVLVTGEPEPGQPQHLVSMVSVLSNIYAPVEAEGPESHVEEPLVGAGVLPGCEPVGRGEAEEPEHGRGEGGDDGVEERDGGLLRLLLLLPDGVLGVGAAGHAAVLLAALLVVVCPGRWQDGGWCWAAPPITGRWQVAGAGATAGPGCVV